LHQYFEENPTTKSNAKEIMMTYQDLKFTFKVDNNVFSKRQVDQGSLFLVMAVLKDKLHGHVLDLGAGYGSIGIIIARLRSDLKLSFIEINARAYELLKNNIMINQVSNIKDVIKNDGLKEIGETYDAILLNPPIKAGKTVIYRLYDEAISHLNDGGALYLVIQKKHGAISTINDLTAKQYGVKILNKQHGYYALKVTKE
jgi:16S rRNA (guanine1207-N2)-methyltransferase